MLFADSPFIARNSHIWLRGCALLVGVILLVVQMASGVVAQDASNFFVEKVQPIFVAKCYGCHGPKVQKSSYRLDVRELAMAGGDSGDRAIVAGEGNVSPLLQYVSDPSSSSLMPPKDSGIEPLSAAEVELVKTWIEGGAQWPDAASAVIEDPRDWWSLQPLVKPAIEHSGSADIDYFVRAKLAEHDLEPSPQADARTLARRLYFDLTGLPPTPEALDEFEIRAKVNFDLAYSQLVDQLLASERYGERWARHWLDVVHYGDTHGYDKDKPRPNAWPYRDYVIRSLNQDKAYARFVEEQIAGDVLWPDTRDGIEALGFIAAGPWDFIGHAEVPESKIDGKIARHLDRDDMVANTIGTFCSVTVHCAQCHQHKFDPITQEDYYSLQAVFAALDRTDRKYYRDEALQCRAVLLESKKKTDTALLEQLERPMIDAVKVKYEELSKRIEAASKPPAQANASPEFGFHSELASKQDEVKWVQIDLRDRVKITSVVLMPCYDDFNAIGAGFGFPVRFKVEVSDDATFATGVQRLRNQDEDTLDADFKNPGLKPYTITLGDDSVAGRYVRVTATKLAPRQNDFNFALAELQVCDGTGQNIAKGCEVASLDSIEAAPRWRRSNLTDGIAPVALETIDKAQLLAQREALIESVADATAKATRRALIESLARTEAELKQLPDADTVYVGGIHSGSGPFAGTGSNGGKPREIRLLVRGQVTMPGDVVRPGALAVFDFRSARFELEPDAPEGARRVALARWITDNQNPLTWRSIVNRVWQYHFGQGIVDTPNDLGRNGGLPSHPELLDWLAADFRDRGGSLKDLHRMIVKSATYRQACAPNEKAELIDSNNRLLWRQNRRRLEAEEIRDAALAISGKLDLTMGGPGWQDFVVQHPEHSPHYEYGLADPDDAKTWRRSIYRFIVRSQTQPWMTSLDCADPSLRVDKRNESLSAIQALALLNNGFMLSQSKHFAERIAREADSLEEQVTRAYRLAVGVSPKESEHELLVQFAREHGLAYLCRTILNLNAFTFVD